MAIHVLRWWRPRVCGDVLQPVDVCDDVVVEGVCNMGIEALNRSFPDYQSLDCESDKGNLHSIHILEIADDTHSSARM